MHEVASESKQDYRNKQFQTGLFEKQGDTALCVERLCFSTDIVTSDM